MSFEANNCKRLHGIISIVDNVCYLVSSLYKTGSSAVLHTVYIFLVALYGKYRDKWSKYLILFLQVKDTIEFNYKWIGQEA